MTAVPGQDSKLFLADTFSGDFRNKTIPASRMRLRKRREAKILLKTLEVSETEMNRETNNGISRHCRPAKGHTVFEEADRERVRSACLSFFRNGRYRQARN